MRCNCENGYCQVAHRPGHCQVAATVACEYIGGVCEACAEYMPDQYLRGVL